MDKKNKKSRKSKPTSSDKSKRVKVTKTSKSIHIEYSDPSHVLPHLVNLATEFTDKHFATHAGVAEDVLGTDAAKEMVSGCANSTCWTCTLGELKLDSPLFQGCVYSGVRGRGYQINKGAIPSSQDTQLYTVVMAIQGAKKQ